VFGEAHDKMRSGAYLNGDNLRIYTACLRISDHCRVRLGLGFGSGLGSGSRIRHFKVRIRFTVANCCIQTAGEGDKCDQSRD